MRPVPCRCIRKQLVLALRIYKGVEHFVSVSAWVDALSAVQDPCAILIDPMLPENARQTVVRGGANARESVGADSK
jgi:hypothetical protein